MVDSLESGNLARNNYQGIIYAVPTNPLPSEPACDKRAAAPLSVTRCQIAQTLPDGTPNPNARFVQAGCETGFNTGNLPGPSGPCNGAAVTIPQGRNRFRGPNYFNTDFTVMKITKLRGWEGATLGVGLQFFNFFNHPNFRTLASPDMTFLTQRSDKFLAWSSPLRAFWALASLEAILPPG